PPLLQIDETERAVRVGDVRLERERALQRGDRSVVVALFGVRLAEEDVQLRVVGVRGEQRGEQLLRVGGVAAVDEGDAVGVLERRIAVRVGIVAQQLRGPGEAAAGERGQRQYPPGFGRRARGERALEGGGRPLVLFRVERGDAERVLQHREVGRQRGAVVQP